jgi:hypothetical protein
MACPLPQRSDRLRRASQVRRVPAAPGHTCRLPNCRRPSRPGSQFIEEVVVVWEMGGRRLARNSGVGCPASAFRSCWRCGVSAVVAARNRSVGAVPHPRIRQKRPRRPGRDGRSSRPETWAHSTDSGALGVGASLSVPAPPDEQGPVGYRLLAKLTSPLGKLRQVPIRPRTLRGWRHNSGQTCRPCRTRTRHQGRTRYPANRSRRSAARPGRIGLTYSTVAPNLMSKIHAGKVLKRSLKGGWL